MSDYLQRMDDPFEEEGKSLDEYIALIIRRRKSILNTAGVLTLVSLLIALVWPPTFQSTATVLIEEQDIPTDLVRSTVTSFAAQRLQVITTRVMTRTNLIKTIEKYNLYEEARQYATTEEIVERMREDTELETVSAEVVDPQTGRPTVATIAFNLSFKGGNPSVVLKVTNELVSLYLNENIKSRTEVAAQTSMFLGKEASRLRKVISKLEDELSLFKEEHGEKLPEFRDLNYQQAERLEQQVTDTENQIRTLQDRKFYLQGQLANLNPATPMFSASGERILTPDDQLRILETEYLRLSNRYQSNHPELVKMRREIESLKASSSGGGSASDQLKELSRLRTELAQKKERYKETHPDVVAMKKSIASIENALKAGETSKQIRSAFAEDPDNPAYITLRAQLDGVNDDIKAYMDRLERQREKLDSLQKRVIQSPRIERDYLNLTRDYENAVVKYREIKAKQMEAEISQELERERKGERFSLVDPPAMPEKPVKPNRMAIVLFGLVLATSLGVGQALIRDKFDGSVYSSRDLLALQGKPPLTAVPFLENDAERGQKKKNRKLVVACAIVLCAVFLSLMHWFWSPLDVLWYRVERKVNQSMQL